MLAFILHNLIAYLLQATDASDLDQSPVAPSIKYHASTSIGRLRSLGPNHTDLQPCHSLLLLLLFLYFFLLVLVAFFVLGIFVLLSILTLGLLVAQLLLLIFVMLLV